MNKIEEYLNKPLQCTITRDESTKSKYKIHINRFGNRHRGITIDLSEENIKDLFWWY